MILEVYTLNTYYIQCNMHGFWLMLDFVCPTLFHLEVRVMVLHYSCVQDLININMAVFKIV